MLILLDFFFADNVTTPVASIKTAYISQAYLLEYMFGKEFEVIQGRNDVPSLNDWPLFDQEEITANITAGGYTFVPLEQTVEYRCAYINAMLLDPTNGV